MDDYVLLDILLGLIVALFAAIGFWRGAVKEVVVTAGVFAGSALAFSWAKPWGADLAESVDMRVDVARIVVAAVALIAATLVLGYGGSALVGSPDVGLGSRLLGAGLAAINGGLLLHYCLWNIERFLTDEGGQEALDQSEVSRILLHQFGWLLLGAAALVALTIAAGQMVRRRLAAVPLVPVSETVDPLPIVTHDAGGRHRPARLPRVADAGKYEPVARGYDPANERYAADAPSPGQTIPLPPVDADSLAHGGSREARGAGAFSGDEWYRRAPGPVRSDAPETPRERSAGNGRHATDRQAPPRFPNRTEHDEPPRAEAGANGHAPMADASTLAWIQRSAHPGWATGSAFQPASEGRDKRSRTCRVCTAEIAAGDSFCPRCGTAAT